MEKNTSPANIAYRKSSFGPAFFFLSKRRRAALAVYYEFCRLMDDLADEPGVENPLQQLAFWREEVHRMFAHHPQTPLGRELAQVAQEFDIPPDRFLLLIEGMEADVQGRCYSTQAQLDEYVYRVAVIVGLATLDILGIKGPQAQQLALHLGSAVQLTNIIRDVPTDAQLGRVYLPLDLLRAHTLTPQEVLAGEQPQRVAAVLAQLDEVAQGYYRQARADMRAFPRLKMLPCRMMGCVYAQNLAKIRGKGFLYQTPIKLNKLEKLIGVFHALFQSVFC